MKDRMIRYRNIFKICLCTALMLFVMGVRPLSADEEVTFETDGKHNGPVLVDPIGQEEGYSAVLYNNTNGLPTSEANDIVQTDEGFIWIGSYGGLIRYDGSRFERIDFVSGVKCLFVDSRNRLWVGTTDAGVILIDNETFNQWDLLNGLKSVSIRSIIEGRDGRIYVATTEGLLMIDEKMEVSYLEDERVINAFLHELRIGADGTIYAVSNPGDVFAIKDGRITAYYPFSGSSFKGINCIIPDPRDPNLVYVETQDGIVYHDSLESGFENSEPIDIAPLYQVQSFEHLDDSLWICTRNGIGVLNDEGFHVLKNLPMNNSIGHVMTDYEGNLWFTSTREGVMKIVKNRFYNLFERYDLEKRVVNSTCMYEDRLFVATDTGLLVLNSEGLVDNVPLNEPVELYEGGQTDNLLTLLDSCRIRSLIRDSKDRLWISTWRQYGLLRYDHGKLKSFTEEDGMVANAIRTVYECDDGSYLVASNGGVSVIRNDRVILRYDELDGIVNTDILSVTEGENGDILIGTDGAGIYIVSDEEMHHIDHRSGLSSDSVMRIKRDRERGVYWLVTGNSLSFLDKNYELQKVDLFPYPNNFDLYTNSKGELWILSSNGIYIAKADDVIRNKEISTMHYSISDGLPCIATANSYSELTDDGNLYIAGTTGVAKVNIEEPFEAVGELKYAIPYVDADSYRIYPDDTGAFTIPADTKKLTIYGYVFTYSLVEPLVTYRLDGFDEYSTTGSVSEVFPVYYTNLSGGEYHFIVELSHSMTDDMVGTVIPIVKLKSLTEQTWFYVYSGLSALLVAYAFMMLYIDKREQKLEIKHREQSEKERMRHELAMGKSIQNSMLPHVFPPFPERSEFDLYASMDAAREVGGDFYDYFFIDDDHLCVLMADVSGKGIPGALFMMISKAILQNTAKLEKSPVKILTKANEAICANNQAQMFVTVWIGVLEISSGKMKAGNAGHEYPIIRRQNGQFEILKDRHDFVLGGMDKIVYHEYDIDLTPGSKIFLYTDGIPEATDANNRMFGMERLLNTLNEDPDADPKELLKNVRTAVDRFVNGAEQFDDLTMLCMEYKGKD